MARMGYPMEAHPSPLLHDRQFEILPLRKDLFYSKPNRYTTRRSTRNSPLFGSFTTLLHKIADTYSSILILAFEDNVCLMGPSGQVLPGVDAFATTMDPFQRKPGRILAQPNPIKTQLCKTTNADGPDTPIHIWGNQDSGCTNGQPTFWRGTI